MSRSHVGVAIKIGSSSGKESLESRGGLDWARDAIFEHDMVQAATADACPKDLPSIKERYIWIGTNSERVPQTRSDCFFFVKCERSSMVGCNGDVLKQCFSSDHRMSRFPGRVVPYIFVTYIM